MMTIPTIAGARHRPFYVWIDGEPYHVFRSSNPYNITIGINYTATSYSVEFKYEDGE